jgi:Bacterial protein of unknown function (DUF922)
MSSKLIGLIHKLEWKEFMGKPNQAEIAKLQKVAATSGKTVGMAATRSTFDVSGSTTNDDIVITAFFNPGLSWKQINSLSASGAQFLLDHEQGHYDITALMARDCFIELMQLKSKTFPNAVAAQDEQNKIVADFQRKLNAIQDTYDFETNHGAWVSPARLPERKGTVQIQWEGFIQTAMTQERSPKETAPDGTTYKVPLLEVLDKKGNFVFP